MGSSGAAQRTRAAAPARQPTERGGPGLAMLGRMPQSIDRLMEFRAAGPVTKKVYETDRTIVTLVCLKPGQSLAPFTHRRREAFVQVLQGQVRVTPGAGAPELSAG